MRPQPPHPPGSATGLYIGSVQVKLATFDRDLRHWELLLKKNGWQLAEVMVPYDTTLDWLLIFDTVISVKVLALYTGHVDASLNKWY